VTGSDSDVIEALYHACVTELKGPTKTSVYLCPGRVSNLEHVQL